MKATYQKNIKKILRSHQQNKIVFTIDYDGYAHHYETDEVKNKTLTLSNWLGDYSNPLNGIFLYKVVKLIDLNSFPVVFCRDGLFCVIDFFHRFPSPENLKSILLINSNFKKFIPIKWRNKVVFYELGLHSVINFINIDNDNKSLIIKGALLSSDEKDQDSYRSTLEYLESIKLKKYKKLKVFLWNREDYFLNKTWVGDRDQTKRLNEFYPRLLTTLQEHENVEFVDYEHAMNLKSLHHYSFIDINRKGYYIGDDFMDFKFISKGIMPDGRLEISSINEENFIPLSPYHGYNLISYDCLNPDDISSAVKELNSFKDKFKLLPEAYLTSDFYNYLKMNYKIGFETQYKKFKIIR